METINQEDTKKERIEKYKKNYLSRCKHFNGIQNEHCESGIKYVDLDKFGCIQNKSLNMNGFQPDCYSQLSEEEARYKAITREYEVYAHKLEMQKH